MSTLAAPAAAAASDAPARPVRHLAGPWIDFAVVGGLSVIVLAAVHLVWPLSSGGSEAHRRISWIFYWAAFVVNWPHFLITYQILYYNYRHELFTRPRFIWAAWVAPALLIGVLVTGTVLDLQASSSGLADNFWLGGLVQTMFLLVGWHFVKQAYGCFVVLSAKNGWFLSPGERRVMRSGMYALWALSFVATNSGAAVSKWNGIYYPMLYRLPGWLTPLAYGATAVTAAAMIGVIWRKARRDGVTPPLNALVALLSIYAWFLPLLSHPIFFLMTPFWHSLQYMLFAVTLSKNRAVGMAADAQVSPWPRLTLYLGSTVVLGAIFSTILPMVLDRAFALRPAVLGPEYFVFCFVWFINVHHYLIDNKLWLRDNAEMRWLN